MSLKSQDRMTRPRTPRAQRTPRVHRHACPQCNGAGSVRDPDIMADRRALVSCPRCAGSGQVEPGRPPKSGPAAAVIALLALLLHTCCAHAATVTGLLSTASSNPYATNVLFTPWSTPMVSGNLLIGSALTNVFATTNGAFSVTLKPGDYKVNIGNLTRDTFWISVPTNDTTYNIISLITNSLTYTYQFNPSYVSALDGFNTQQFVYLPPLSIKAGAHLTNFNGFGSGTNAGPFYAQNLMPISGGLYPLGTPSVPWASIGVIDLQLADNIDGDYVTLAPPADGVTDSYTLRLPTAQGAAGHTLTNDGSGNLGWSAVGAGGGSGDVTTAQLNNASNTLYSTETTRNAAVSNSVMSQVMTASNNLYTTETTRNAAVSNAVITEIITASNSLYSTETTRNAAVSNALVTLSSNSVRVVAGTGGITVTPSGSGGVMTYTVSDDDAGSGGGNLQTNANQFGASSVLTIKDGPAITNLNGFGKLTNAGPAHLQSSLTVSANQTNAGQLHLTSLTGQRALISDSSKQLTESSVTETELGYVSGVTSGIQAQLTARTPSSSTNALTRPITNLATSKTLWLDATNGNDATFIIGDATKPARTVAAALDALQSDMLLHVRPGWYLVEMFHTSATNGLPLYGKTNIYIYGPGAVWYADGRGTMVAMGFCTNVTFDGITFMGLREESIGQVNIQCAAVWIEGDCADITFKNVTVRNWINQGICTYRHPDHYWGYKNIRVVDSTFEWCGFTNFSTALPNDGTAIVICGDDTVVERNYFRFNLRDFETFTHSDAIPDQVWRNGRIVGNVSVGAMEEFWAQGASNIVNWLIADNMIWQYSTNRQMVASDQKALHTLGGDGVIIERNMIHGSQFGFAFNTQSQGDMVRHYIRNNSFVGITDAAIKFILRPNGTLPPRNIYIEGNNFYQVGGSGIIAAFNDGSIKDNVFIDVGTNGPNNRVIHWAGTTLPGGAPIDLNPATNTVIAGNFIGNSDASAHTDGSILIGERAYGTIVYGNRLGAGVSPISDVGIRSSGLSSLTLEAAPRPGIATNLFQVLGTNGAPYVHVSSNNVLNASNATFSGSLNVAANLTNNGYLVNNGWLGGGVLYADAATLSVTESSVTADTLDHLPTLVADTNRSQHLAIPLARLPATNYPVFSTGFRGAELWYSRTNLEGGAVAVSASWQTVLPVDYRTNTLALIIHSTITATNGPNSSNVIWRANVSTFRNGTTNDFRTWTGGSQVSATNTWSADHRGTNQVKTATINLANNTDGAKAGDLVIISLDRNVSSDTYVGASAVVGLELRYTK